MIAGAEYRIAPARFFACRDPSALAKHGLAPHGATMAPPPCPVHRTMVRASGGRLLLWGFGRDVTDVDLVDYH